MRRASILLALVGACESTEGLVGPSEPIAVTNGTFFHGEPPRRDEGVEITAVESASGIAIVGQQGRSLAGRVGEDAHALAIRVQDLGTGWWIAPIDGIDPALKDERTFGLRYDLGATIPPGLRRLELAAVDGEGQLGPSFELDLCVLDPQLPDDINVCDPASPPPAAAVVLHWDRNVDLDLRVRTPDGKVIDWRRPTSAPSQNGGIEDDVLDDPTVGVITRDSNAGCVRDGRNTEAVVWPELPGDGPYSVYVRMFDACGELETPFEVFAYRRKERSDGTFSLEQTDARAGALLNLSADGGGKPSLFVLELDLD